MTKLNPFTTAILAISLLSSVACNMNCVSASGNVISETREVGSFSGISLRSSGKILLKSGGSQPISIKSDDNILALLKTEVKNGTLVIYLDECVTGRRTLEIEVFMDRIKELSISGSGEIVGLDEFKGDDVELNISGSGDILVSLDADNLESSVSGSGTITITGKMDEHKLHISGSGDIYARDLSSETASAFISGSGSCQIHVRDELDAHISGSGTVEYSGSPKVKSSVSGSGKVISRGN
jgi:hypothetical protein